MLTCNKEQRAVRVWWMTWFIRIEDTAVARNTQICDICGDAHYQTFFNPRERERERTQTAKQNETFTLCDNSEKCFLCRGTQHVVWGHLSGNENGVAAGRGPNGARSSLSLRKAAGAARCSGSETDCLSAFMHIIDTVAEASWLWLMSSVYTMSSLCSGDAAPLRFTNQCGGADLDNSRRAAMMNRHRCFVLFNNGRNDRKDRTCWDACDSSNTSSDIFQIRPENALLS